MTESTVSNSTAPAAASGKSMGIFLPWLLANGLGGFVTGALEGAGLHFFATLLLQGVILGIAQALVLRGRIERWWLWAAVTAAAFPVGLMFAGPLSGTSAHRLAESFGMWEVFRLNAMTMAVTLLIVSIGQWAVFQELSSMWILLGSLAGVMLGMSGATVCLLACDSLAAAGGGRLATGVTMGAGWLVYALPTGLWLAGQRLPAEADPENGPGSSPGP